MCKGNFEMMKNIFVSTIVLSLIVFPSDGLKLVGKVEAGIAGGVRKVSEKLKNRTKCSVPYCRD